MKCLAQISMTPPVVMTTDYRVLPFLRRLFASLFLSLSRSVILQVPFSKVIVIANVQVDVEGFAVAVSVGREDVLVEGAVHADGCGRDDNKTLGLTLKRPMRGERRLLTDDGVDVLGRVFPEGADAGALGGHGEAGQRPLAIHVLTDHGAHLAHACQPETHT